MKNPNLTSAEIKYIGESSDLVIKTSLSHIVDIENYRNLLIIKSETIKYTKYTIYPINRKKILKVTLVDLTHIDEDIETFFKKLQKYKIIHSSGLVLLEGRLFFECYLDLSLDDEKYKDLKIFLEKNKSKFKDIKLEELSLSKREVSLNGDMES